jgi:hypothetical protein
VKVKRVNVFKELFFVILRKLKVLNNENQKY